MLRFFRPLFLLSGCLLVSAFLAMCTPPTTNPPPPNDPIDPAKLGLTALCPGAKGCLNSEGELFAGAAAVAITPTKYEVARWSYFEEEGFCPPPTPQAPFGLQRCGKLLGQAQYNRRDCGTDGICPRDKIKTRLPCSKDQPCATGLTCNEQEGRCYLEYQGPDADGSEGDKQPDWFLDCGRDRVCPCADPSGQPSYYGPDKKTCLKGHTSNPEYKGPDADGSEGNGTFEGLWMGGFSGNHPLQGFHDDTWARALVIKKGETTVAIVSVDLVGFFYDGVLAVRKAVSAALKESEIDYILISATHTHEGPDTMGQWGPANAEGIPISTGVDPEYFKEIVAKTAQAVLEAHKGLKKAEIAAGVVQTGGTGFFRDSRDPIVIEDTMNVLKVTEAGTSKILATLVNWGNHPEVLSDTNNFLTSDFPHYLRDGLEKGFQSKDGKASYPGHGGVSIYLQGTVGCLMTPLGVEVPDLDGTKQGRSDYEKSRALGQQLAVKANEALNKAEKISATSLAFWVREVRLPVDNRVFQLGFNLGLFDRETFDYDPNIPIDETNTPKVKTEIAVLRIGDISFYTLPGEVDPETLIGGYKGEFSFGKPLIKPDNTNPPDISKAPQGPYLKEKIPGKYKFFVGLGNDSLGYFVPSWNFQLAPNAYLDEAPGDHYEETNSLGPKTEPLLMENMGKLLEQVLKSK